MTYLFNHQNILLSSKSILIRLSDSRLYSNVKAEKLWEYRLYNLRWFGKYIEKDMFYYTAIRVNSSSYRWSLLKKAIELIFSSQFYPLK